MVELEKDNPARTFRLMNALADSMENHYGAFITPHLFVPRYFWFV